MDTIADLLSGFWTWHTPMSFLAGIGAHHLYCRFWRDRKTPMFTEKSDGSYRFSTRFWAYTAIATLLIVFIGVRTQLTANRVEQQARETTEFSRVTKDCLNQLIVTLKDRTAYNGQIEDLNDRERRAVGSFMVSLSQIPEAWPPRDVDLETRRLMETYFAQVGQIDIDRQAVKTKRAQSPYPEPNCGLDILGP